MEKKYEMPRDAREYMEKIAARIRDEKVRKQIGRAHV